jgi:hypothetical protein
LKGEIAIFVLAFFAAEPGHVDIRVRAERAWCVTTGGLVESSACHMLSRFLAGLICLYVPHLQKLMTEKECILVSTIVI